MHGRALLRQRAERQALLIDRIRSAALLAWQACARRERPAAALSPSTRSNFPRLDWPLPFAELTALCRVDVQTGDADFVSPLLGDRAADAGNELVRAFIYAVAMS